MLPNDYMACPSRQDTLPVSLMGLPPDTRSLLGAGLRGQRAELTGRDSPIRKLQTVGFGASPTQRQRRDQADDERRVGERDQRSLAAGQ